MATIAAVMAVWTSWTALRTASAPQSAWRPPCPELHLPFRLVGEELGQQVDRVQEGDQGGGPRVRLGARHHGGPHPVEDLALDLGPASGHALVGNSPRTLPCSWVRTPSATRSSSTASLSPPARSRHALIPPIRPTASLGSRLWDSSATSARRASATARPGADQPAGLELGVARFGQPQRPVESEVDDRGTGHGSLELGAVDQGSARGIAQGQQKELDGQRSWGHAATVLSGPRRVCARRPWAQNPARQAGPNFYRRTVDLLIASLAERPDLADRLWDFEGLWPVFMQQDPVSDLFYSRATTTYAAYTLLAFAADDLDRPVARSCSIPFAMGAGWPSRASGRRLGRCDPLGLAGRAGRPRANPPVGPRGRYPAGPAWDGARVGDAGSQAAERDPARVQDLFAPVRPSLKTAEPRMPMASMPRGRVMTACPRIRGCGCTSGQAGRS